MIKPEAIGRTFKGAEVTITQKEIDDFCAVLGATDTSVAPPTFSIRISLDQSQTVLTSSEVGVDWDRIVHGDQKFEIHQPLKAGDVVRCDCTLESYKQVAGNEFITARSDLYVAEKLAVTNWSTLEVRAL
ncbi:MAG: FAS1-like dehydratase domain-containing protein [Candidatus Nanopelagicaceae bacterium]